MRAIGQWNDKHMNGFKQELNDVFRRFFGDPEDSSISPGSAYVNSRFVPVIDVEEKPDRYTIEAEIPGVGTDDIVVEVEGNVLTIKGERKEGKDRTMYLAERRYGTFKRFITLPENSDPDQIKAENHKGILYIDIPKKHNTKQRRIDIKDVDND